MLLPESGAPVWTAFLNPEDFPNLGHAALDDEHAQIARLTSNLHDAMLQNLPTTEQRFLLHELEVNLRVNCRSEEEMMESDRYPNRHAHIKSHELLYAKLHNLDRILIMHNTKAALEALIAVRELLLKHVKQEDHLVARWHRVQHISPDSPD